MFEQVDADEGGALGAVKGGDFRGELAIWAGHFGWLSGSLSGQGTAWLLIL
jgi:hypothetical protein